MLPLKEKLYKLCDKYPDLIDYNLIFTKALLYYCQEIKEFQNIGKYQFVVIKKDFDKKNHLLYDGRFIPENNSTWPLKVWFLNHKKQFLHERKVLPKSISNLPKTSEPLTKLLHIESTDADPQTLPELKSFLERHHLYEKLCFRLCFAIPDGELIWLTLPPFERLIIVFTKNDYTLGYKERLPPTETIPIPLPLPPFEPDKNQHNRSAAVNVKVCGLNEAYNLGCITMEELKNLSHQLAETCGCIKLAINKQKVTKFITFRDTLGVFHFEISNTQSWFKFFDFIFKKKTFWKEKKAGILHGLMQQLKNYTFIQSPFKKCYLQLQQCIDNYKIVLHSSNDSQIHGIKLHLAHYLNITFPKKYFNFTLNHDVHNNLTVLKNKDISIFNLNAYLSDFDLFPDLIEKPIFENNNILLRKQKSQLSDLTVLKHCKLRGEHATQLILTAWQNVGLDFLLMFDFDIFSMPIISLSYLSFQTVWTKYTRQAGPYHHGLEKTKPYYENMLRSQSHGGYFYSCQDKLDMGEPLHKTFGNPASSIFEFDIISSYGFASSHVRTPSGFCYGYIANENGILKRCDKTQRHKTFEFLSVFYTLHQLEQQGYKIQTVYSNFHQFGIFSLAHYPIDLVVVCENQIFLYQFDGQYVHGCIQCRELSSYVGNRTHDQVLQLTKTRNEKILEWCDALNKTKPNYASFIIKTDCHDYNVKEMLNYFKNVTLLASLLECYPNAFELDLSCLTQTHNNCTFIADLYGYIPSETKALFFQAHQKNWTRDFQTTNQSILLTKDYLTYLQSNFNFQITSIKSVFFYKNCNVLNQVFQDIVHNRMDPQITPGKKLLLKNIINFSAGFFGYNQNKANKITHTIVHKISHKSFDNIMINPLGTIDNYDYFIRSSSKPIDKSKKQKSCSSPLPLYVSIVEFGKMRMAQILVFLDNFIDSNNFRHLYTNIDNIILALAYPTIEQCVKPELKTKFLENYFNLFQDSKPGHFKLEYVFNEIDQWKFVSPFMQTYALITKDVNQSVHKNSALRYLSSQNSYDYSCKLLDRQEVHIPQIRRVNKIVNMDVQEQIFQFNKTL